MRRRNPFTVTIASVATLLSMSGCGRNFADPGSPLPKRERLDILATIEPADEFWPSSVVRVGECSVWIVGDSWGVILEVDLRSGTQRTVGRLPWLLNTHFTLGIGPEILAWSTESGWAGRINPHLEEVQILDVPTHPWTGDVQVGPMTVVGDRNIAMAPLGRWRSVKSPRPWVDVPEVWLFDEDGRIVSSIGSVLDRGGGYLSAFGSQVALGSVGDSLTVVNLLDGTVFHHLALTGNESLPEPRWIALPEYFDAPIPSEEIYEIPWIQVGGDVEQIHAVTQVFSAVSDPTGLLWTIRNGGARWNRSDSPLARQLYERSGYWEVTDRWLEVYDATGSVVDRYDTPAGGATSVIVDGGGEFFVIGSDGRISIARNPYTSVLGCGISWSHLSIETVDGPDVLPELEVVTTFGY